MRYMNPKQEAEDLVALFEYKNNLGIAFDTGIEGINKEQAKECAKVAVCKILDFIRYNVTPYTYDNKSMESVIINRQHYIKVIQEIEQL